MTGRQDVFQQALNAGHSAAWDQLWDRAAAFYRQALEEFPAHPQALVNLGLALYELQDYESSLQYYLKAARAAPNDPIPFEKAAFIFERLGSLEQATQAYLRAAEVYLKNRDVNKAVENWQRVTRLQPENVAAHTRLAVVFDKTGDKDRAVDEYIAAASLLQSTGQVEKAAQMMTQALQTAPHNPKVAAAIDLLKGSKPLPRPQRTRGVTAPLRMAQVRQLQTPSPEASADASQQDPITEACQKALTLLAGMLFEGGEDEKESARAGLQSMLRGAAPLPKAYDRSRVVLHLSQVVDLQTREQYSQAIEDLEKAMEAGLDHPAAYFDLGFLYYQSGRLESAIRHLQSARKASDFELGSHLLLGELLFKMGRFREASLEFLEALKFADMQTIAEDLGDDLRQLYEPLVEAYRYEENAENHRQLSANVSGLLLRHDWRSHLTKTRQQLPVQPPGAPPVPLAEILTQARSSQVVDSLSKVYELAERGQLDTAMEECFYALQHAPTYLPLHTYIGELLLQQNRVQEAATKFTTVARTYASRGEQQRAVDIYRRVVELTPMDLTARTRLIDQLFLRGKPEEALCEYVDLAAVYYSLADLEMVRKTYTEALKAAQQSKVDRQWRVKLLHLLADIALQSLDWRQALRIYEQIRTVQPDDEKAWTNLVDINFRLSQPEKALTELDNYLTYLHSARRLEDSVRFLDALVRENPERIPVRLRLGEAYRAAGRREKAIQELDWVGDALLEAGDSQGAAQAIQAILSMNPPNKTEYQFLLNQIKNS
jgi:tetratricopeptide (TPR) repeat protein